MLTLFLLSSIVGDAMGDLLYRLRKAQFGLAILFCNQVLKMPFTWLQEGKGPELVRSLGVDILQLNDEQYCQKYALDSLEDYVQAWGDFEKLRAEIARRAGLDEYTEATMPSGTPHGSGDPMDL